METGRLALIAGSGVAVSDLVPGGEPRIVEGSAGSVEVREAGAVVVLSRHGSMAGMPAHRVDHRANVEALVALGCDRVLALASTGSLRADWPVGTIVFPVDLFAPWVTPSAFDDTRGHTVPGFDIGWRSTALDAWRAVANRPALDGGVYVQTIGPRFETPAEIRFFATVGDVVGMTLAAECILAKELGLAYAAVCIVDNMANGIDDVALTRESFDTGVAQNRAQFAEDVRRVTRHLLKDAL